MKRHIDETDIFKPVSPSLKDDNDWPILPLANADVTQDNGGDVMSLLLADEDNQLAVTGRVESLDSEERQFRKVHQHFIENAKLKVVYSDIQ